MRTALLSLLLLLPASASAQGVSARCAPRVEATAAVSPSVVARLTAAVSSGAPAVDGACPTVRFDIVDRRLVMTVVLDDGRQVARVLPSQNDALPTLVALLATPPIPEAEDVVPIEAPTTPEEAPPVVAPAALAPTREPAPLTPAVGAAPAVVAPRWAARLGVSGGIGRADHVGATRASLDAELLRERWVVGVRASYERQRIDDATASGVAATLSLRPRWTAGRFEIDAGPSLGARWIFDDSARGGLGLRAGAEASVAVSLWSRWSVFARIDGGAEFSTRDDEREERASRQHHDAAASFAWGAAVGLRWEVLR